MSIGICSRAQAITNFRKRSVVLDAVPTPLPAAVGAAFVYIKRRPDYPDPDDGHAWLGEGVCRGDHAAQRNAGEAFSTHVIGPLRLVVACATSPGLARRRYWFCNDVPARVQPPLTVLLHYSAS